MSFADTGRAYKRPAVGQPCVISLLLTPTTLFIHDRVIERYCWAADLALKPPAPPAEGQRPNPEPHKKTSKGRQLPEETEGGAESVGHRKVSARMDDENAMLTSNTRPLSAVADADAEAGPVASPLNLFLVPLSALLPASPSGGFLVVPPSTMLWSVPASMLGSAVPFANPSTVSSMSHSAVPHTAPLTAGLTDYRDR
ncbi:hypothetical protein RhiLY_05422 [Ceratobasidium sp. AG-Ba]|nr:hypothetical protein RhiLY_05422 [Ceratobasidium sp. AG-Ba]